MATKKKLLQAAAGAAGGEALNVEDVFTNWLYTGDDSTTGQTIQNGVDYTDGEERLVWIKARSDAKQSVLVDTVRGVNKNLSTANTTAEDTEDTLSAFTSNGFTVKHTTTGDYAYTVNRGSSPSGATDYVSWTFRKAPKFFDVVTYTGTGSNQNISHSLGCVPGFVVVKKTSGTGYWSAWHRSLPDANDYILLSETDGALDGGSSTYNRSVTDTTYQVFGDYPDENQSGQTYVAYLFAHNDGDGEFGPDGDADIIKCGGYTGNGSTNGPEIDLGFEPQWIITKRTDSTSQWVLMDSMRGMSVGGDDVRLYPNLANSDDSSPVLDVQPTGFKIATTASTYNASGGTYIYIAIRRGPMAVPESATEVFAIDEGNSTLTNGHEYDSSFPVDMAIRGNKSGSIYYPANSARLIQGKQLITSSSGAETSVSSEQFDFNAGYYTGTQDSGIVAWMWRRAPNFFDVVCYTGDGTAGRTVSHNLGVAPEMMWVKCRSASSSWPVYHKDLPLNKLLWVDLSSAEAGPYSPGAWNGSAPTDIEFTVSSSGWGTNDSGSTYIAYLFASLDGVSKVGSYTGNGSTQTIDCGFSSGARFVLVKCATLGYDWQLFDTERGIVSGNDSKLALNTTQAEQTNGDFIDPSSSGFAVTSSNSMNANGETFIFYAIA
jgi:hypothetical protein